MINKRNVAPIGPFSLAVKNRDVRKTAILRWKLLGNYAKSHPKDRQKNPAPECDFSNSAWNFPTIMQWGHSPQKNRDFCHVTSRNFRFITRALTILHTRVRVFFTIEYLPRAVQYSAGNGLSESFAHAHYLLKNRDVWKIAVFRSSGNGKVQISRCLTSRFLKWEWAYYECYEMLFHYFWTTVLTGV